ncbi:hybrid sensor histidine kinase/response regulator [Undibacterium terreum]|uniref:histidine kinase n=1 Tax=Undibacterium terreum TaxID=1224302 RepID=A0A916U9F1_9BURK|nr:PAS domain S-box protein [Undibacterium terreum]GGC64289.1 histidine kinase [Undibacterium terreum]
MPNQDKSDLETINELQRFQILVASISDYAIYMLDINGKVISWNPGAHRSKGYTAEEIIGKNFSTFYTPEDQAAGAPARALSTAAAQGRFETEGWRVRKDGTRFWASVIIDPILEGGKLLGFAKITRDITERKAAEEALRQSEQQFRLLVQGVTDYAIYMLDTEGNVSNWNPGAQRIKGYTQDEIVGSHFSRFYTEEDRESGLPQRALKTAATEGKFEQEGWRVRKDGTVFQAHVVIDPIYDATGILVGYAKITRDITEKQQAQAALKRTEQALQHSQKMETIGKLTGGVAHDFNNLLQIISGNLQLLSLEINHPERAKRRIANALEGVKRGAKLASYLLAFGRRQALDPKVVNIGNFVDAMEDMLQRSLGEEIDVKTIVAKNLWNTLVDVAQLENALLNLAVNARDAMDGVGSLTIEMENVVFDEHYAALNSDVQAGEYVMLAVTDTGTGMPEEILTQVFEPFFSTKPEGKGTGLGLSMVYGFVKQSGGHVNIYSEPGDGTTIKLYLPRSLEAQTELSSPAPQEVVGGTETILVAEDDEQLCASVVETLSGLGYHVLKAGDAASAMTVIESGVKIDLLFTDVVMPGQLRSPDLVRQARALIPGLAVLFTSGYTQNAIVHGGRLDAGVELLSKPYTREDLAKKIRHVIANQKQRDQIRLVATDTHGIVSVPPEARLSILLAENDDHIRSNTADLLRALGHRVEEVENATSAIEHLHKGNIDVLITDVELVGMSGDVLARQARDIVPAVGIVFATGRPLPPPFEGSVLLRKPYTAEGLKSSLKQFEPLS